MLSIHSSLRPKDDLTINCGQNSEKIVSFDDIVHLNDGEDIMTFIDFDCGLTFYPEPPIELLSDLWKPGAVDGILPCVMNSNCN